MSLFWRVFGANASVLTIGLLVLILTPVSVNATVSPAQAADLVGGLVVLLVVNFILLRPLLRPLPRLVRHMQTVDVLQGVRRIPADSPGEIGDLERGFNEMLERLEAERREAGTRTLNAQERERERIARGLHDEVGQTMTGILFQLNRVSRSASPAQRVELSEAQAAVRTCLDEVRRIAQELRPETLDHLGLTRAVKSLAGGFARRTGITVKLELTAKLPGLDSDAEVTIYRVVQESLTNVAKHSGADEVRLSLKAEDESGGRGGKVVLRVVDNGRGFNGGRVEGAGLRGIRERALIVGAALAIKPSVDGGAEIRLELPPSNRRRG